MTLPIRSFCWLVLGILSAFLRSTTAIESNNAGKTRSIVPGAYIVEFSPSLTRLRTNDHV